jgi:hypothetical protein
MEAMVNTAIPRMTIRRWPTMSDSRPPKVNMAASASR